MNLKKSRVQNKPMVCYGILKFSREDRSTARWRGTWGEVLSKGVPPVLVAFGAQHSGTWEHSGFPTRKLSETPSFRVLRRLHCIRVIGEIIGHWRLIYLLLFLSLEIRGCDWTFQPSIPGWFPWQPACILRCFAKVTSLTYTLVWWKEACYF